MDNEQQHTPEPWLLDERGGCIAIYDGEHINCLEIDKINFVAYWSGFRDGDNRWNVHAKDSANAARIVACVNACAGMADPIAEIAKLRSDAEWVMAKACENISQDNQIATMRETLAELVQAASYYIADNDLCDVIAKAREVLK